MIVRNITGTFQTVKGIKVSPFMSKNITESDALEFINNPNFEVDYTMTENERMHGASKLKTPYKDTSYIEDLSDVDVFVPAYNQHDRTRKCLQHLENSNSHGFHLYLIDNNSEPSLEELLSTYTGQRTFIRRTGNDSFSVVNNGAARRSMGKYILLLNNDCYVNKECLGKMRAAFDVDPKIAVVGAKLLYPDEIHVQHCGVVFANGVFPIHFAHNTDKNKPETNMRGEWPAVTAACMMVRRDIWDMVGGLGEEYVRPGGTEDIDFCCKIREKGYSVWYEPTAVATHEESVTSFSTPKMREERQLADHISADVFQRKWCSRYANLNSMELQMRLSSNDLFTI